MSLVVLPLCSGDESIDSSVKEVVLEFLTTLRAGRPLIESNANSPEPAIVVPEPESIWRADAHIQIENLGSILLPSDQGDHEDPEIRVGKAIRIAFEQILRSRSRSRSRRDKDERVDPAIIVLPILVVRENDCDAKKAGDRLSGLGRVRRWIDATLEGMADRTLRGPSEPARGRADVVVSPWCFIPQPPRNSELPQEMFAGPINGSARPMYPIVYTGSSEADYVRLWEGYGQVRLLSDLYALHGLSASLDEINTLFPSDSELRRVYTFHSALFEYPLDEHVRRVRLSQLMSPGGNGGGAESVLPDPIQMSEVIEAAADDVKGVSEDVVNGLSALIAEKGLADDFFDFGGGYPHDPDPRFEGFGPREDRWQRWFRDRDWPIVGPQRYVDRLHSDVDRALQYCAQASMDSLLEIKLQETQEKASEYLTGIERLLQKNLAMPVTDEADSPPLARIAFGRVLALTRNIQVGIQSYDEVGGVPPDAEEVVAEFATTRSRWIEAEEELLQAGGGQASLGGFMIELASVGLAVVAVTLMSLAGIFLALIPLFVGGLLAALLFRRRRRQLLEYFRSFDELGVELRVQANGYARRLVAAVNFRARQVKLMAVRELRRALAAADSRFRTEVRGFIGLVKSEQALLSRKHRRQEEGLDHAEQGRFCFVPDVWGASISSESLRSFHTRLSDVLTRSLRLTAVPNRIAVSEYEDVVDHLVAVCDGQDVESVQNEGAVRLFEQAIGYGADFNEMTSVGALKQVETHGGTLYVIVGRTVGRRLGEEWSKELESLWNARKGNLRVFSADFMSSSRNQNDLKMDEVLRAFAQEVAVVLLVKAWDARGADC